MENDFKLIVHNFSKSITIYPISDVHLGSLEHNSEEWEKGAVTKPAKIVIDSRANLVTVKPFTVITSQSWLSYGGYAMQKMLLPSSTATADGGQKLLLNKSKKAIKVVW